MSDKDTLTYVCINCHATIKMPVEEIPKCLQCDGKVFNQLRSGNVVKVFTSFRKV